MSEAIWSPQSQQDLAEIAYYIAKESARPATAERIIRDAHDLANLIAANPEMGAARPGVWQELPGECIPEALDVTLSTSWQRD